MGSSVIEVTKSHNFKVDHYYYYEPKVKFNIDELRFRFDYKYTFSSPFEKFSIVETIAMELPKLKERRPPFNNKIKFSEIETITDFLYSKDEWIHMGILTSSGEEINHDINLLPNSIGVLLFNAMVLTKDAMHKRQINTDSEGMTMLDIPLEELVADITKREFPESNS
ncbi:MAG TPA: hypothetical protein VEW28_00680 [Candidatus Kapabacteria bacterium]|nr:hypothetical protein [Candidatus Kapabacteria bacterium]